MSSYSASNSMSSLDLCCTSKQYHKTKTAMKCPRSVRTVFNYTKITSGLNHTSSIPLVLMKSKRTLSSLAHKACSEVQHQPRICHVCTSKCARVRAMCASAVLTRRQLKISCVSALLPK